MKRISKNINVIHCDFETLTPYSMDYIRLGHTDVYRFGAVDEKTGKRLIKGQTLDQFMKWLFKLGESTVIYFHNLSFDGNFIYKWLFRNEPEYYYDINNKPKNKRHKWSFFAKDNKIYSIDYDRRQWVKDKNGKDKKKDIKLFFKCSYNILSTSIYALGKAFGVDKHNEDTKIENFYDKGGFNMDEDFAKILDDYLFRDVEIQRRAMVQFKKMIYEDLKPYTINKRYNKCNINVDGILTIASLVTKMSRNYIYNTFGEKVYKGYTLLRDAYEFSRNWFYGAFTQFNPKYHNRWLGGINGTIIDMNSDYPYQMTKLLPYGELQKTIPKKSESKHYLTYYKVKIKSAIIKHKYRNFVILKNWDKSSGKDTRYTKELYNQEVFYCKDEWDLINKIYNIEIENIETYYAKADYLLKDFIEDLYSNRVKAKKEKKFGEEQTLKIMLNALFGMNAKRMDFESVIYMDALEKEQVLEEIVKGEDYYYTIERTKQNGEVVEDEYKYVGNTAKTLPNVDLEGLRFIKVQKDTKTYANCLIGAQITSYARVDMWNTILAIGIDNWLYSDTDSIFCLLSEEQVSKLLELDDYKLGAWKVEGRIKEGKILGAKRYGFVLDTTKIIKVKDDKGKEMEKEVNDIKVGFCGARKDLFITPDDIEKLIQAGEVIENGAKRRFEDDFGIYLDLKDIEVKAGRL